MTPPGSPLHFDGSIPNASRTPRDEVGGLALFEGVLMRSRTGFAIAMRRPDGAISLRQIPFASLISRKKAFGFPVLRGTAALGEMMVIGTRALHYSSRTLELTRGERPTGAKSGDHSPTRLLTLILASLSLMIALFIVVPDLLASVLFRLDFFQRLFGLDAGLPVTEADHPILFNLLTGLIRLGLLIGYIVGITFSSEVRRVFAYHGAEHQSVLALEEGADVTVARARKHDTLHPRCGTTLLALIAIISVPLFAIVDGLLVLYISGYPDWPLVGQKLVHFLGHLLVVPVIVGLCFELLKYAGRRRHGRWVRLLLWPGYALQRLTTRRADDHQLEVAIVALFGALAIPPWEKRIRAYTVRGLEDDESAPGYVPRSPARPAPGPMPDPPADTAGTGDALPSA